MVIVNDDGAVVKRRILEEQVHYQSSVDVCVDSVTCLYDVAEAYGVGDDDKRSCLLL